MSLTTVLRLTAGRAGFKLARHTVAMEHCTKAESPGLSPGVCLKSGAFVLAGGDTAGGAFWQALSLRCG